MKNSFVQLLAIGIALTSVSESFAADPDGYPRLMQGPMVGAVEADSILVWVRAAGETPVRIQYGTNTDFSDGKYTEAYTPKKANDYCLTIPIEGLEANTEYYYRIEIAKGRDSYLGKKPPFLVKTAPAEGEAVRFRMTYGSCARFQKDRVQPIWGTLAEYKPDLFFWLGDNVYADTTDPDIVGEEFGRQREVSGLQPLLATIPQLAIWDDHDFGLNNHDRTNPWKRENLAVWKQYWPNPGYGLPEAEGIFFKYTYGGVDFFFLDTRYYRDPNEQPDSPEKTMLGAAQMEWLKASLKASTSPFKILISGSLWTRGKGPEGDAWSAFLYERDALFDWMMAEAVTGVVLLSGDPHVAELNVMRWSSKGGYDLYDLTSSPLAQEPEDNWIFRPVEQRIRVPYNMGANFGMIDFDLTKEDPTLTFNIIGLEGNAVWTPFELKASELVPGVSSWQRKQTKRAAQWMQLFENGWESIQ